MSEENGKKERWSAINGASWFGFNGSKGREEARGEVAMVGRGGAARGGAGGS